MVDHDAARKLAEEVLHKFSMLTGYWEGTAQTLARAYLDRPRWQGIESAPKQFVEMVTNNPPKLGEWVAKIFSPVTPGHSFAVVLYDNPVTKPIAFFELPPKEPSHG